MNTDDDNLTLKHIWSAPGYRELTLECVDATTGKTHRLWLGPADMQRLINECAGAVKQIGGDPPIDWAAHPTQIWWPSVTPWKLGEQLAKAGAV